MVNIQEDYPVTANTKCIARITSLPLDFKPCNWHRPVGEGNLMQSVCNLTIMNSYSDDVITKRHLFGPTVS